MDGPLQPATGGASVIAGGAGANSAGQGGSSPATAGSGPQTNGGAGAGGGGATAKACDAGAMLKVRLSSAQSQPISGCDVSLLGGTPTLASSAMVSLAQTTDGDTLEIYCKGFVAEKLKAAQCGQDLGEVRLVQSPNILFAIADDASQDSFDPESPASKYVNTPTFDKLAAEGVWFANAYDSAPKCSPARASLLTGRHFWQNGEAANHYGNFPADLPRYTKFLADNGWDTATTGKGWGPGTNLGVGAGKEYTGAPNSGKPASGISGVNYAANFKTFLDQTSKQRPWAFWYGALEPHRDYEAGSGVKNGKALSDVHVPKYYPDEPGIRGDLADYAIEVEWYDKHLGQIVEHLRAAGTLDRTIILATSDHGMPFPRVKGNVYEQGHHVPLVVRWPELITAGRKVTDFVNFPDFAPTYLELAGLRPPPQMTGRSFLNVLRAKQSGQVDPSRDFVVTGRERTDSCRADPDDPTIKDASYPIRTIRKGDFLYLHNLKPKLWPANDPPWYTDIDDSPTLKRLIQLEKDAQLARYYELSMGKRVEEELYNIKDDPECVNNLAADPGSQATKQALRAQMEAFLKEQKDPRTLGNGDVFERYPHFMARPCAK